MKQGNLFSERLSHFLSAIARLHQLRSAVSQVASGSGCGQWRLRTYDYVIYVVFSEGFMYT